MVEIIGVSSMEKEKLAAYQLKGLLKFGSYNVSLRGMMKRVIWSGGV